VSTRVCTGFLLRLDRRLDDAVGGFSGWSAGPAGVPGLDIAARLLPFLREDGVNSGTGGGCGGGDACATRCRLGLRDDGGDSAAPWAGLVLFFRFRALGAGFGVGGAGGGGGAEVGVAVPVVVLEEAAAAAWLAA
jgi:hypothetical protein